jgi:hypothetical protein
MEKVKNYLKEEKAKLSKMDGKQKADYIFTYYKVHILIALFVVISIGWLIHHYATYVSYELYGMVINSDAINEDREKDIHDYLGMEGHDGVDLTAGLYTDETANAGGYGNRLDILFLSNQCDFVFTDEAGCQYIEDFGLLADYYVPIDISESPIHEYFGLDDNTNYLIWVGLSGNQEYMDSMMQMMKDIDSGLIK